MRASVVPLLLLLGLLTAAALATPDANGDYFSNLGPVQAAEPAGTRSAGSLWRVVADGLAGRRGPGLEHPVVLRFPAGTVLQADVGRGGSDEVLLNARDASGKPWMRVRTREGRDLDCYVRANRRYVRPVGR